MCPWAREQCSRWAETTWRSSAELQAAGHALGGPPSPTSTPSCPPTQISILPYPQQPKCQVLLTARPLSASAPPAAPPCPAGTAAARRWPRWAASHRGSPPGTASAARGESGSVKVVIHLVVQRLDARSAGRAGQLSNGVIHQAAHLWHWNYTCVMLVTPLSSPGGWRASHAGQHIEPGHKKEGAGRTSVHEMR